jgi:hypothetical protein
MATLATREDLKGVEVTIAEKSGDVKDRVNGIRSDIKQDVHDLRSDMKQEVGNLRTDLKVEISDRTNELKLEICRAIAAIEALQRDLAERPRVNHA